MNQDIIVESLNALLNLSSVFELLPVGIYITDNNGKLVYYNKLILKWMPGFKASNKLFSAHITEFIVNKSPQSIFVEDNCNTMSSEISKNQENIMEIIWNNHVQQFRIKTVRLLAETGFIGVLEIVENLTNQYIMNNALLQAKRFENVGRLASGIAHDFNNILQVINGHSEILLGLYQEEDRLVRGLDVILASGLKASALTRQLLLFSRQQENEFKPIHLQKTFENIYKIISRMVGEDITMSINFEKNKLFIDADESQIEQIVLNMTVNARDAMPEGGTLSIIAEDVILTEEECLKRTLTKAGKYVKIRFIDNGCGICQENLNHIFEPFFTTKDIGKGSGLGLSTVYSIVRQHHGEIEVQSELNKGSVFSIYFPATETEEKSVKETHGEVEKDMLVNCKVLIIEDDIMVRDLSSQVLTLHGCNVEIASTVKEAMDMAINHHFDLYLVDIVLPDGSGIDLIESIEKIDPEAAFLLSSGYTEDKPQIRKAIEGGHNFLHKPYTINTLLLTCQDSLKAKRSK